MKTENGEGGGVQHLWRACGDVREAAERKSLVLRIET